MKPWILMAVLAAVALAPAGCRLETKSEVDVKPIEIKPIQITIDVNVKVDKALDDFFGDLDAKQQKLEQ